MKVGWNGKTSGSLQRTAKSIEVKLQSFKKIIEEIDLKKENPDQLEGLKSMLKKDYKSLIESSENVFLPEELREIVSAYKDKVENTISLLNA